MASDVGIYDQSMREFYDKYVVSNNNIDSNEFHSLDLQVLKVCALIAVEMALQTIDILSSKGERQAAMELFHGLISRCNSMHLIHSFNWVYHKRKTSELSVGIALTKSTADSISIMMVTVLVYIITLLDDASMFHLKTRDAYVSEVVVYLNHLNDLVELIPMDEQPKLFLARMQPYLSAIFTILSR